MSWQSRLTQVAGNPPKLTWSRILSSKCLSSGFRDRNAVNWLSWGKKAVFSIPATMKQCFQILCLPCLHNLFEPERDSKKATYLILKDFCVQIYLAAQTRNDEWWVWNFAFAFGRLRASWDVECLTVVETQINTFPQSACPQTPSRTWQTSFNWKSEQLLFHWSFHLSMYWGCHYPILRCVSSDMMIIFCKNSWKPQTKKDISWSSQSLSSSFLVEIFVIVVLSSLVLFPSIERKVSDTRRKP